MWLVVTPGVEELMALIVFGGAFRQVLHGVALALLQEFFDTLTPRVQAVLVPILHLLLVIPIATELEQRTQVAAAIIGPPHRPR